MSQQPPIRLVRPGAHDVHTEDEILAGVPTHDPVELPTAEAVLDCLVANNGIPTRVAARLGVTEEYVLSVITKNTRALSTRLRSRLMLSSFSTLLKIDGVLQASLDEMPMDAVGRTYAATLGAFTQLAGQFEEQDEQTDTDDASTAKLAMLDRLENIKQRERAHGHESAEDAG